MKRQEERLYQRVAPLTTKHVTVLLATVIILLGFSMTSWAAVYNEETESQVLGNGIEYFKRLIFDSEGWTQIHYYKVDLASPDVNIKLLYDKTGLSNRQKLSDLVTEKTVGAVNGDFFALATPSTSLGLAIDQGVLLATPSQNAGYSSLVIENQLARVFKESMTKELIHNGLTHIPIESYNRTHTKFYKVVVLDKQWGSKSFGVSSLYPNMLEIVVVGGIVQEVRDRMPAIEIKEGMQVVIANEANRKTFENVKPGDTLVMNLAINLDPAAVTMGIGGGCRVIQNGVKVPFLQDLTSRQPRTAFGIANGGQTLYLATFDGRSQGYKGMNGNELASFFLGLGCTDAMILDGGGSTTFFKKNLGDVFGQAINYLADGTQRKVVTGIGIENLGVSGVIKGIELKAVYNPTVAVGSSTSFLVKAYDEAYQPMTLSPERIEYKVINGSGVIKGGRFYPDRAGDHLIQAQYMGKTADILVTAYQDIDRIAFETDTKEIKPDTETAFIVYAYTTEGFKLRLSSQDLGWKDSNGLGRFDNGMYKATVVGETLIEAQFLGYKAQVDLRIGTDQIIYNEFETNGLSYTASSPQVSFLASYDSNAYSGSQALAIDYQFAPDANNRAVYVQFDKPIQIDSDIDRIGMYAYSIEEKPNMWIRLQATDAAGNPVTLDMKKTVDWSGWKYIQATLPSTTAYPLQVTKLYIVDVAPSLQQNGSISFDRLLGLKKKEFRLSSLLANKAFTDPQRGLTANMGPVHAVISGKTTGKTVLDQMMIKQIAAKLAPYERVFATSPIKTDLTGAVSKFYSYFKTSYSKDLGDVTVVKFSNKLGGLRKTSSSEWLALNALATSVTTPGLVMLLDENPFTTQGFYEPKEFELFKKRLESIATQGKEVVVIYEGAINGTRLENDVRYISIKKMPTKVTDDLKELRYLEWTLYQGKFYYDFKPLMVQ